MTRDLTDPTPPRVEQVPSTCAKCGESILPAETQYYDGRQSYHIRCWRALPDAAPDLLAACKAALVQIDTLADWSDLPDDVVAETERVFNQLKAAIARAEAVEAFNLDEQGIRASEKRLALAALDATPTSPIALLQVTPQ